MRLREISLWATSALYATLSDNPRYLLAGLWSSQLPAVRPWLEWAFHEYGLPEAIRTDNGTPFARWPAAVSVNVEVVDQLGIRPERIKPGKPAERTS